MNDPLLLAIVGAVAAWWGFSIGLDIGKAGGFGKWRSRQLPAEPEDPSAQDVLKIPKVQSARAAAAAPTGVDGVPAEWPHGRIVEVRPFGSPGVFGAAPRPDAFERGWTDPEPLDDAGARLLRKRLEAHHDAPVLPLGEFCTAMTTWFEAIERNNRDPEMLGNRQHPEYQHGASYYQVFRALRTDIEKSNLLWRLLYSRQPLRTRKCPEHDGHWDGRATVIEPCPHECGGTGWLPE